MPDDNTRPDTETVPGGAGTGNAAEDEKDVQHTSRTHSGDRAPTPDGEGMALLTTDPEAQQTDSVINPESS